MVRGSILIMPIRAKYEWENNFLNEIVSVKISANYFIKLDRFEFMSDQTNFNSIDVFVILTFAACFDF